MRAWLSQYVRSEVPVQLEFSTESLAELRKAVELEPGNASTHMALARALSAKGLTGEAEKEMHKAQQTQPQ